MDKGRLERRYNLFKDRSKFHNNELCDNFIGSVTKANGFEVIDTFRALAFRSEHHQSLV